MPDDLPQLIYSLGSEGQPVVVMAGAGEFDEPDAVLGRLPGLFTAEGAAVLAQIANHFAREFRYEVIEDPAAFERDYRARLAAEDPDAPYEDAKPQLHHFGVPDFAGIAAPRLAGAELVFYARDTFLGVPYRVVVPAVEGALGTPSYAPVELAPAR